MVQYIYVCSSKPTPSFRVSTWTSNLKSLRSQIKQNNTNSKLFAYFCVHDELLQHIDDLIMIELNAYRVRNFRKYINIDIIDILQIIERIIKRVNHKYNKVELREWEIEEGEIEDEIDTRNMISHHPAVNPYAKRQKIE